MEFLIIAVIVLIIYPYTLLYRVDPFERRFPFKRDYTLKVHPNIGRRYCDETACIKFTKRATSNTLGKALAHAFYLMGQNSCIKFESAKFIGRPSDFDKYHFKVLDFSNVEYKHACFPFMGEIDGRLPCDILILPKDLSEINLYDDNKLENLVLPCDHLLQYTPYAYYPPGTRFEVHCLDDFVISVPPDLVSAYCAAPSWQSIDLISDDGTKRPIEFRAYYE